MVLSEIRQPMAPLYIYEGQTVHARFTPFEQRFQYGVGLIDLDIDRLEEAANASPFFSVDQPNLFSFRRRDHGAREDQPLRPWAEAMFATASINLEGGAIRLVTMPRHLFYKFSPISLWFGYGPDGELRGVLYEVNNTFGDTHTYVAATADKPSRHTGQKALYVSPFFDVTGAYRFTLVKPDQRLGLTIENIVDGERTHVATLNANRAKANTRRFTRLALRHPFLAHGVTFAIHWEALKLWLKGAGYRSRPPATTPYHSQAQTIETRND